MKRITALLIVGLLLLMISGTGQVPPVLPDAKLIRGTPISKATPSDDFILKYDLALDSFMLEADAGGGSLWDTLGSDDSLYYAVISGDTIMTIIESFASTVLSSADNTDGFIFLSPIDMSDLDITGVESIDVDTLRNPGGIIRVVVALGLSANDILNVDSVGLTSLTDNSVDGADLDNVIKVDSAGNGTNVVEVSPIIFKEGTNITLTVDANGDTVTIAGPAGSGTIDSFYVFFTDSASVDALGERVNGFIYNNDTLYIDTTDLNSGGGLWSTSVAADTLYYAIGTDTIMVIKNIGTTTVIDSRNNTSGFQFNNNINMNGGDITLVDRISADTIEAIGASADLFIRGQSAGEIRIEEPFGTIRWVINNNRISGEANAAIVLDTLVGTTGNKIFIEDSTGINTTDLTDFVNVSPVVSNSSFLTISGEINEQNVDSLHPILTLRNTDTLVNTWATLAFSTIDSQNTVLSAWIAAQKIAGSVNNWTTTDLVFATGVVGAEPQERLRITGAGVFDFKSNDLIAVDSVGLASVTDNTIDSADIVDNSIDTAQLKTTNLAADEDIMTYEATGAGIQYQTAAELGLLTSDGANALTGNWTVSDVDIIGVEALDVDTLRNSSDTIVVADPLKIRDFALYRGGNVFGQYDTTDVPVDGDVMTYTLATNVIDWQPDNAAAGGSLFDTASTSDTIYYIPDVATSDTILKMYHDATLTYLRAGDKTGGFQFVSDISMFFGKITAVVAIQTDTVRGSGNSDLVIQTTGGKDILIRDNLAALRWTLADNRLTGEANAAIVLDSLIGTADTILVADPLKIKDFALYTAGNLFAQYDTTDTPTNGQVLTWATGNILNWQTASGGAGVDSSLYVDSIMVAGNTETGITVTFNTIDTTMDFVVAVSGGAAGTITDNTVTMADDMNTFTETELETQLSDVTALFTNNVTGDVTVAASTSTIGTATIDSLMLNQVEIGEWMLDSLAAVFSGDATMLETGVFTVVDDLHNHVITNIDAFTETQLETQLSDVTALFTNNVTGDVTVAGATSTIGTATIDSLMFNQPQIGKWVTDTILAQGFTSIDTGQFAVTISAPNGFVQDTLVIMKVDASKYADSIIFTELALETRQATTDSAWIEVWTNIDHATGAETVIDTLGKTTSRSIEATTFNARGAAQGSYVILIVRLADASATEWHVRGTFWEK